MAIIQDFDAQEKQLKAQLEQIESNKKAAIERDRDEKLGLITTYENEAVGFRNQALKAESDSDKRKLYGFADDCDQHALELRRELGLVSETEVETEAQQQEKARLKTARTINSLLLKALFALGAFLLSDFTSARLEMGFMSFAAKSVAQIFYALYVALGGCWLVCTILYKFIPNYSLYDLKADFLSISPSVRLGLLVALIFSLFHFLTGIISNV